MAEKDRKLIIPLGMHKKERHVFVDVGATCCILYIYVYCSMTCTGENRPGRIGASLTLYLQYTSFVAGKTFGEVCYGARPSVRYATYSCSYGNKTLESADVRSTATPNKICPFASYDGGSCADREDIGYIGGFHQCMISATRMDYRTKFFTASCETCSILYRLPGNRDGAAQPHSRTASRGVVRLLGRGSRSRFSIDWGDAICLRDT